MFWDVVHDRFVKYESDNQVSKNKTIYTAASLRVKMCNQIRPEP